jgi:hypothetical protein
MAGFGAGMDFNLSARNIAILLAHHAGKACNQRGASKHEHVLDAIYQPSVT